MTTANISATRAQHHRNLLRFSISKQTRATPQLTPLRERARSCAPRARGHTHRPCQAALATRGSARFATGPSANITPRALSIKRLRTQGQRMAGLAIKKTTEAAQTAPTRRVSRKIRNAVALLVSGECKTVSAAAARCFLSRSHLSRSLHLPHIRAFAERELAKTIGVAQLRAGSVMANLMDSAKSEHVKKDASEFFLGLMGHVVQKNAAPVLTLNNNVIVPGYFLDLRTPQEIAGGGHAIEHNPPPRDDEPIERTTTAEPSTVVPWHTVRPVGRQPG